MALIYDEDKQHIENLNNFKYSSEDLSILSNYVMKHFFNLVIKIVPRFIAPNLLSVMGCFCMLISGVLIFLNDPNLLGNGPKSYRIANTVLLALYYIIDNIDGKQAIRTQTITPLGQLFDHGVDSIVLSIIALSLCSAAGVGMGMNYIGLLFMLYIGFYIETFYERIEKKMVFGYINGPTEGIIIVITINLLSCFFDVKSFGLFETKYAAKIFKKDFSDFTYFTIGYSISYIFSFLNQMKKRGFDVFVSAVRGVAFLTVFLIAFYLNHISMFLYFRYMNIISGLLIFSYLIIQIITSKLKDTEIFTPPDVYFFYTITIFFNYIESNETFTMIYASILTFFILAIYILRIRSILLVYSEFLNISIFKVSKKKD